jgi:hypothetical protein
MKLWSWFTTSQDKRPSLWIFFTSPYLSVRSLHYKHTGKTPSLVKLPLFSALTFGMVFIAQNYLYPLNFLDILLFSPAIYFLTEALGAFGQTIFFIHPSFAIHRSPLYAKSISHFWGRDWNLWVQDWLRDVTEGVARTTRSRRIIYVFLISGFFHEIMCNLPYWMIYRKSYFGTMMGYFFIQAVALWFDKKVLRKSPSLLRRIFLWAAVILPSPLFINVPILTFFGLTHE